MAGRGGAAARAVHRCCSSSRARSHSTAAAAAAEPGPPPPLYVRSAATTAADAMGVLGLAAGKRGDRPGARPVDSLAHLVKRPSDSLLCVELPFGRDAALRAANVNWRGQLRVGKLLEELDAFAGAVAYRHVDDGDPGSEQPTLVTASTDRVDLVTYPLRADQDMQMRGMVTYVGASSLNIDVDIVALPAQRGAPLQPVLLASTTFVARNRRTGRALPVPRLAPATPRELQLHEAGRLASEARRAVASSVSLDTWPLRWPTCASTSRSSSAICRPRSSASSFSTMAASSRLASAILTSESSSRAAGNRERARRVGAPRGRL